MTATTEQWNQHHRWRPRTEEGPKANNTVVQCEEDEEEEEDWEGGERSKSSTCLFSGGGGGARHRRQGTHGRTTGASAADFALLLYYYHHISRTQSFNIDGFLVYFLVPCRLTAKSDKARCVMRKPMGRAAQVPAL